MFWRKKNSATRMRMLAFRALFAAGCFSAFAIFGWGIETATVLELLVFLILVVIAMIIPAAIFVGLLKLMAYGLKQIHSGRESAQKSAKEGENESSKDV